MQGKKLLQPPKATKSFALASVLQDKSKNIVFKKTPAGKDIFSIESRNGKIIVSGNNANSMAVGLNYYLKNYCHTEISWYQNEPIDLPASLPTVDKKIDRKSTRLNSSHRT